MDVISNPLPHCPTCNGAGTVDEDEPIPCAACDGSGQITAKPCICCDGLGRQQVIAKAICPRCLAGYYP